MNSLSRNLSWHGLSASHTYRIFWHWSFPRKPNSEWAPRLSAERRTSDPWSALPDESPHAKPFGDSSCFKSSTNGLKILSYPFLFISSAYHSPTMHILFSCERPATGAFLTNWHVHAFKFMHSCMATQLIARFKGISKKRSWKASACLEQTGL